MKKSLFEMLGIADQERIHTQIIAWLLSPEDSPLNSIQRAKFIQQLFNVPTTPENANQIHVVTELKHLDLVVVHPTAFIAVENKMKSSQGVDQLQKYSAEIEELVKELEKKQPGISQRPKVKVFLTFSGESPKADDWNVIDYQHVLEALNALDLPLDGYAADYTALLGTLLKSRDEFIENHKEYPQIFKRSGMKTYDRLIDPLPEGITSLEQFVCGNRLERIFIERLYRETITKEGFHRADVTESRGQALIHLNLFELRVANSPYCFHAGFQLQGDTIKLNIGAKEYPKSKCDWLPEKVANSFDEQFKKQLKGAERVNPSRTRAYRSWTRQVGTERKPEEMLFDEFCRFLTVHINEAVTIWTAVLEDCHKSGVVTEFSSIHNEHKEKE